MISLNAPQSSATVSGSVTDCNNNPVSNGYIMMLSDNFRFNRYSLSGTGTYSFSTLLCNGGAMNTFVAEDNTSMKQSMPVTQTINAGANVVGNLQACSLIEEFITCTIDGGAPFTMSMPGDSIYFTGNGSNGTFSLLGYTPGGNTQMNISFSSAGIATGSVQQGYISTIPTLGNVNTPTPLNITITEYGPIDGFIAGNSAGQVQSFSTPIVTYNIVCSFRARRYL